MLVWLLMVSLGMSLGCGVPTYSVTAPLDPQIEGGLLDLTQSYLTSGSCAAAYSQLQPFYNSANTDNNIRMAMAAVYGCYAKVSIFQILNDMVSSGANFAGAGLWTFMATEFASTANPDDKIPLSAENGTDAILATLNLGTLLDPTDTVNSTSYNPGSLIVSDRTTNANTYLTFMSMALMGSLLSRYGVSNSLPWTTATSMKGDPCAFVSSVLNFYDGLSYIQTSAPASVAPKYAAISGLLSTGLNAACSAGCTLCGGSVSCTSCPTTLRDRSSCTGLSTDVNSCAGSGIVLFVNASW